jgi:hypothetical protein
VALRCARQRAPSRSMRHTMTAKAMGKTVGPRVAARPTSLAKAFSGRVFFFFFCGPASQR